MIQYHKLTNRRQIGVTRQTYFVTLMVAKEEVIVDPRTRDVLQQTISEISQAGLYKKERLITSAQKARIQVGETEVLNMCANNYLDLADNPQEQPATGSG